ncbi:hypothetical protein IV102_22105 [bacterium]|nr:hypothetical protein [bacterium]
MGNPGGSQALFCELVGTRAATWLELPTLQYFLVDVTEPELVTYADGTKSEAGPAFITRLEDGTPWGGSADELRYVENIEVLAGLIVLDTWLLNCDRYRLRDGRERRNVRNLFLTARDAQKGKFRVLAMDHTHCFTCGRELTGRISNLDNIRSTQVLGDFPEFCGYVSQKGVSRFAERLSRFGKPATETLLASIPKSWGISAEVCSSVGEFLVQLAGFVGENVVRQLSDRGYFEPELDFGRND